MDWSRCFVCGQAGDEYLRCLLDSNLGSGQEIYTKFVSAVEEFQKLNAIHVSLEISTDLLAVECLVENRAKWHRSCYLKFNKTKL